MNKNHAIILAAGQGQRMAMKKDKMLLLINGKPLIYYSIIAFNDHPDIDSITLVTNRNNREEIERTVKKFRLKKVKSIVLGGINRKNSLQKGLQALKNPQPADIILVHNGANPLPSQEEISEIIHQSQENGAAISAKPITNTIKELEPDGRHILKTHDRSKLYAAETPQAANYATLEKALSHAIKSQHEPTDEAMMLEAIGQPVSIVQSGDENFKITTQADYHKLRSILGELPDDFRTGIGQDSHHFDPDQKGLTIGGITLPEEQKLQANSDGDVILHAIFNALSQAIGEQSLGFYADPLCEQGVKDSKKYLEIILKKVDEENFQINSLGLMIECKRPKIDPISAQLKKSLSTLLNLSPSRIGITATSGENLTSFGAGMGIQCFAIISLVKSKA